MVDCATSLLGEAHIEYPRVSATRKPFRLFNLFSKDVCVFSINTQSVVTKTALYLEEFLFYLTR